MSGVKRRHAPTVQISLLPSEHASSGEPVDLRDRLLSFTFEDCETKADRTILTLVNHDLRFFEDERLAAGSLLTVSWGYLGNMAPPRRVVVQKLKGFDTLTVEGFALSVLMNRQAKSGRWENLRHSDVARAIAGEHGYSGSFVDIVDTDEVFPTILQASETDAQVLTRLARTVGFVFYVDHLGLHWRPKRTEAAPTHTLTWYADQTRGDILSVHVESEITRRAGKVVVRGRDPLGKRTMERTSSAQTATRPTLAEVIEVVDPESGETSVQARNATVSSHPTAASSPSTAQAEAKSRFTTSEQQSVKLRLTVVGDPSLTAKRVIEVRGISSLLSGKYYVTEATHTISTGGYVTTLSLRRDGVSRRGRPEAREQTGERNQSEMADPDQLLPVETVDPESGSTHIEYRRTS